jgi:GH25 family lysozyme M1 (1,4-beta-N-acetylmuramidase)
MWQYSSDGSVEGINWTADLNISFKDYSETDKTAE